MDDVLSNYESAVDFLNGRIDYERLHADSLTQRNFKLDRMKYLLNLVGNPQESIPVVHVAGTKGKGSTVAMISEMLLAAGLRVGSFTSPHISSFTERMTVAGSPPTSDQFVALVNKIKPHIDHMDSLPGAMKPTFFEICTALAWLHFVACDVQMGVFEVGLGGRLDSTNICNPQVCVITNISFDHTALLGNTLASIASEKAGIVKPGCPVVSGVLEEESRQVIVEKCKQSNAPLFQLNEDFTFHVNETANSILSGEGQVSRIEDNRADHGTDRSDATIDVEFETKRYAGLRVALRGQHQQKNAALAIAAVHLLRKRGWDISDSAIESGLGRVRLPLRFEVVKQQPIAILDAAHNAASIQAVVDTLNNEYAEPERVLIFAATRGKDVDEMLRILLPQFSRVILTAYENNPRALPLDKLAEITTSILDENSSRQPRIDVVEGSENAWQMAKQSVHGNAVICVTGSFFIAAEMRQLLLDSKPVAV